jgi:hypothetical protein
MHGGNASLHKGVACCRPILYLILSDPVVFRSRSLRILSLVNFFVFLFHNIDTMASRTILWIASLASVPFALAGSPTYSAIFQNPLPLAPIATPARLEI